MPGDLKAPRPPPPTPLYFLPFPLILGPGTVGAPSEVPIYYQRPIGGCKASGFAAGSISVYLPFSPIPLHSRSPHFHLLYDTQYVQVFHLLYDTQFASCP